MTSERKDIDSGNEDLSDASYDYLVKVLLLGDSGVGKTCFLHQYTEGEFKHTFIATVGVDFRLKKMDYTFPDDVQGSNKTKIHLQLWDTAGQERYRSLTKAFFRDGMGFLLLFDISSEKSFSSVRAWLNEIREQAHSAKPDIILVGNKSDLRHRVVTKIQAEHLAKELEIPYIETSALNGANVTKAVSLLLDSVMKRMKEHAIQMQGGKESSKQRIDSYEIEQQPMLAAGNKPRKFCFC